MNTESPNEMEMQEIESLLRKLPLHEPSADLDGRVQKEFRGMGLWPMSRAVLMGQRPMPRWRVAAAVAVVCIVSTAVVLSRNVWRPLTTNADNSNKTAIPHLPSPATVEPEKLARAALATDNAPYSGGPLRVQRTLAAMSNEGLLERAGETPVHVYRCETVKEIFFVDPEHKSRMSVTVPIERVVMIPVQSF